MRHRRARTHWAACARGKPFSLENGGIIHGYGPTLPIAFPPTLPSSRFARIQPPFIRGRLYPFSQDAWGNMPVNGIMSLPTLRGQGGFNPPCRGPGGNAPWESPGKREPSAYATHKSPAPRKTRETGHHEPYTLRRLPIRQTTIPHRRHTCRHRIQPFRRFEEKFSGGKLARRMKISFLTDFAAVAQPQQNLPLSAQNGFCAEAAPNPSSGRKRSALI